MEIASGNSDSYYSGTDHSNQIKFLTYVIGPDAKVQNLNFKLKRDTLDSVQTSFHFGFELVAFVNITYLKLTKF